MRTHLLPLALIAAVAGGAAGLNVRPAAAEDAGHDDCARLSAMSWEQIEAEAKGQTVQWWMWSGDPGINQMVDLWVAKEVKDRYGINLKRIAIKDTVEGVQQVVQEAQAGRHTGGSVDLNWISEENLKTLMQGKLLCRGYRDKLPNAAMMDFSKRIIGYDGDIPIEDWALPWSMYQYVYVYNTDHVKPAKNFAELGELIKANPGKFTYPTPPDFTGRGMLMNILYEVTGGADQWLQGWNEELWKQKQCKLWDYLNDIKPHLWRNGETYPETVAVHDQLYGSGEVWFTISAYQSVPGRNVARGAFPKATRTGVVDIGTIAGNGQVGIPYNSSSKAAAMVVLNFLLSPEAQYQKALPDVWGDGTVLDLSRVPDEWRERFKNIPREEATLDPVTLGEHQVGTASLYNVAVEEGWRKHVLKGEPYSCP